MYDSHKVVDVWLCDILVCFYIPSSRRGMHWPHPQRSGFKIGIGWHNQNDSRGNGS